MLIFLNLGKRKFTEELLPECPFRAFVMFSTAFVGQGGVAVLSLEDEEGRIGNATIDWTGAEQRPRHRKSKYLVATGSLDEVDVPSRLNLTDREKSEMVVRAMKMAGWAFEVYDPHLDTEEAEKRFAEWIEENL